MQYGGKGVSPMILSIPLARGLQIFVLLTAFLAGSSMFTRDWLHAAPKSEVKVESEALPVVNINKATAEELQNVRGIGPALAERIVQYRDDNGRFARPEDLVNVRGIGEAKFQKIRNQISI